MHLGFDLQGSIPRKMILTDGKGAERPFVSCLLEEDETGVLDRGYQDHQRFDSWIDEGKHFVVRLKKNTQWEVLKSLPFEKNNAIFFFAKVLIGHPLHKMSHSLFVVGFKSRGKTYWIATDRDDLTAEQIAFIYSLRWQIENFFAWWKKTSQGLSLDLQKSARGLGAITFWTDYLSAFGHLFSPTIRTKTFCEATTTTQMGYTT